MGKPKYNPDEIVGKKFGKWTVIEYLGCEKGKGMIFKCKCECGKEQSIRYSNLIRGSTTQCKSCSVTKHGYTHTRLYGVWKHMIKRCYNKNDKDYKWYGALGVKVCDDWKNDFTTFHDWAYSTGYDENAKKGECTIDRIDTEGNYEPSNCKWSTMWEQNINQRKRSTNTTGYTGIYLRSGKVNVWVAIICINHKYIYLGSYKTQKEALEIRNEYITTNNLPYKIQEYRGELVIVNDEQRKVQEEWEKQNKE